MFVCEKGPPVEMLLISSAVAPVLVRVVVKERVSPISVLPKLRLAGLNSTSVPAPVRGTVCGLPDALSVNDSKPVRVPI